MGVGRRAARIDVGRAPRVWIEPHRLVVIDDRAAVVALSVGGEAAAGIGLRICRIELYRLVEVGAGTVVIVLADTVDDAAAGVGRKKFRIELDRLVEAGDRVVLISLP